MPLSRRLWQCRSLLDKEIKRKNKKKEKPMEEKKEPTKWEKYAKGKKPSMKRRCNLNDYCDRGIYMITIAIEGRRPLLGRLAGDTPEEAYVVLSAFGERVKTY